VSGLLLVPLLGLDLAIPVLGALALVTGAAAAARSLPRRWWPALAVTTACLLVLLRVLPSPDPCVMNAGIYNRAVNFIKSGQPGFTLREAAHALGPVVFQRDGLTGRIAVRRSYPGGMTFIVNGKPDGSTAAPDLLTEIGSMQIALLCHPRPRKVLVVGMGTGISTGSATVHPGVEEVHVVEIEPLQTEVARIFAPYNHDVLRQRMVRVHLDDARRFLLGDRNRYDVIVSEPSNLFVSGMVNLYTVEALRLAKRRLAPGGILLQWIHYYQIGERDLLGALATFREAFPWTTLWMHDSGDAFMMGTDGPLAVDLAAWEARGRAAGMGRELGRIGMAGPLPLLAFCRLDPEGVADHAAGAPLCRDDFPYLEFTTPLVPWNPETTARRRDFLRSLPARAPVPLARETAAGRVKLGRIFLDTFHIHRARVEYARALFLDPGSGEARRKLKEMEEYSRPARTNFR